MAINIPVEVTGNATRGLEDLKARLVSLIQRTKELSKQGGDASKQLSDKVVQSTNKIAQSSERAASQTERAWKKSTVGITSAFTSSVDNIVNDIVRIPKSFALVVGGLAAVGTAMAITAKNFAEANKDNNETAGKFSRQLEELSGKFKGVGESAASVSSTILSFFGITGENAESIDNRLAELRERWEEIKLAQRNAERQLTESQYESAIRHLNSVIDKIEEDLENSRKRRHDNQIKRLKELEERQAQFKLTVLDTIDEQIKQDKARQSVTDQITASLQRAKEAGDAFDQAQRPEAFEQFNDVIKGSLDAQNEKTRELERTYYTIGQIGASAFSRIAGSINTANDPLLDLIKNLSVAAINFALFGGNGGGFVSTALGFKKGGVIPRDIPHAQSGMIVRRPTLVATGEGSQPEAIVPLSPNRARDRARVMQDAGLSTSGNVTVNLNLPNISFLDPITLRNRIMPEINRQVRRGERLVSSSTL